jgi:hypothetical protein
MAIVQDDANAMINAPDGFDARNSTLTQHFSTGIMKKPVLNSF